MPDSKAPSPDDDTREAREFRAFQDGWWAAFHEVHQRPGYYFEDTDNCLKAIRNGWAIYRNNLEREERDRAK